MGWACLTSRERIRYRTMRPRSTASVWLSKSGELMPGGGEVHVGKSPPLGLQGGRQGEPAHGLLRERGQGQERRVHLARQPQGLRVGQREWKRAPHGPLASSPVMLSTNTCHLCSSCSSCRISRFWRRSATVSSGVRWDGKEGHSKITSTLYWSSLFQQELLLPH